MSASRIASSISEVTNRIVCPLPSNSRSRYSCMSCRVMASSPLNGSSINRTRGRLIRARASSALRCMPPESWLGYLSAKSFSPTFTSKVARVGCSLVRRTSLHGRSVQDILRDCHPGKKRRFLKNHEPISSWTRNFLTIERDAAMGRLLVTGNEVDEGRLAASRRADQDREFRPRHRERAVLHHRLGGELVTICLRDAIHDHLAGTRHVDHFGHDGHQWTWT